MQLPRPQTSSCLHDKFTKLSDPRKNNHVPTLLWSGGLTRDWTNVVIQGQSLWLKASFGDRVCSSNLFVALNLLRRFLCWCQNALLYSIDLQLIILKIFMPVGWLELVSSSILHSQQSWPMFTGEIHILHSGLVHSVLSEAAVACHY